MVVKKVQGVTEHAVSPVVGVMLMLVATIIIAAVVSSFGTGLTGDVDTASNARVELVGVSLGGGVRNTLGPVGVVFKNAGGGSLDLRNLRFYATGSAMNSQGSVTLTYNDPVSLSYAGIKNNYDVRPPEEAKGYRMQKFGSGLTSEDLKDPIVEPGERFIIYAEYYKAYYAPAVFLGFKADRGDTDTATWSSGAIAVNGGSHYTLSDINTGTVYSEGYLESEGVF